MSQHGAASLERIGVAVPNIVLPRADVDLYRWAVIACDQHTSEPDYWEEVEEIVGGKPSTLRLIYPEVYLGKDDEARIASIHETMREYLDRDIAGEIGEAMILTKRGTPHVSERRGLLLAIDLEHYDFRPDAKSLIRATEQTIVERIPPRVRIREGAPLELPHVLVLVDDRDDELFGGLLAHDLPRLYETQLMLGGGEVSGYRVDGPHLDHVADVLTRLLERSTAKNPFLFAVGDGNHSLATAKAVWERQRDRVGPDHPSRYALVEVVNLYDPGLRSAPIHRLVDCADPEAWVASLAKEIGGAQETVGIERLAHELDRRTGVVGYIRSGESGIITLANSRDLPVVTVQEHIDRSGTKNVDYIHGWDTSVQLGQRPGSVVIVLPRLAPNLLFPTVAKRGVLPRKAFSIGEAEEKRYYLEARRID